MLCSCLQSHCVVCTFDLASTFSTNDVIYLSISRSCKFQCLFFHVSFFTAFWSIRKDSLSALSGPNFPVDDSTNRPGKLQILRWSEGGSDGRMMAGMQVTSLDISAMGSNGVAKGDCVILRYQCILTLSQLTTCRKQFLPRGSVGSPACVNMFTPRFVYLYILVHIEY